MLWRRSPGTPLTIPPLALGLGILMLFNLAGAGLSFGGLLAGHMALCVPFAFMNSFDNVALSLFLSGGRGEVLPIRLWHIIEDSLDMRAAAASGLLIVVLLMNIKYIIH